MDPGVAQSCLQEAIRGKIGDPNDGPVAAAHVVLSGSRLARRIATRTGSEGYFMFNRVPPGIYTLEVACAGFGKLVQRGIAVQEHAITGLDLKMDFQEDSRSLRLRALSLKYIVDGPERKEGLELASLACQLREAVAGLRLERALFNPPPAARVGRSFPVEFGLYQNLRDTIGRRLRESHCGIFDGDHVAVALTADLQAAGCRVLPRSLPRLDVGGARYQDWRWEVLPQAFGRGLLRLDLRISVDVIGMGHEERSLLALDREILIRRNRWLSLKRGLKNAIGREEQPGYPDC
ncbi:MAG: carboxypeptidase-like regulatory domain-containing protein [Acidobacteria bacterium]|jgi:hypothetical protein|nr:carboxypeptidase-like regulatory domain-containing protein [Acidobacteriota bacterium]